MKKLTVEMIQQGGHTYKNCKYLLEGIDLCGDNSITTCACKLKNYKSQRTEKKQSFAEEAPTFTKTMDIGNEFNEAFFESLYQEKLNWMLEINNEKDSFCHDCKMVVETAWGAFPKLRLTRLFFTHSFACNCNCIYCNQDHAAPPNKRVVEFLIRARDLGYLFDNRILEVGFAGGEPTLLPDFVALFEYTKNARDKHGLVTSAVMFHEDAAKLLANPVAGYMELCVSLDAGTPEIYSSIKQVNQFERVVGNINKYYGAALHKKNIQIKYLVVTQNCSKEQIDSFIKLIRTNGWQNATFSISNNRFTISKEEELSTMQGVDYLKEQLTKLTKKEPHLIIWE